MANKAKTTNHKWVAQALADIREGTHNLSYHLLRELEKLNLIEPVFVKVEGRGRPIKNHIITGKGRGMLGLSTKWKREIAS